MRNIALRLRYDGSRYHGWQVQKKDSTVAQTMEDALEKVLGVRTKITGCGRTDAGVHALRYCANFRAETAIPVDRIPLAINLPDFNAISSCLKKEYIYKILNSRIRDPFLADRVCFWPQQLDMSLIARAAAAFIGTHDFRAVRSVGTETKTTVRTVYSCHAEKAGDIITISICADGFLYNMCRAMVGTMVYAAYGKLLPEEIPSLLAKGDRRLTGPTMPPQGLYLNRVWYDGPVGELFLD